MDGALIIGVDRLDFTPERNRQSPFGLRAISEKRNLTGGVKVTYLQIAPKKAGPEIPEYADMEQEIGSAAGRINGTYGEAYWTPIRYVNRTYSHSTLAGLYRAARVLWSPRDSRCDGRWHEPRRQRNMSLRRILPTRVCSSYRGSLARLMNAERRC